jgi:fructosamine-3-kinase
MPASESDISWQVLRRIVRDWAGNAAELQEVAPLTGGCINLTLKLTIKDGISENYAVLKISPHRVDRALQREAHQLDYLRTLGVPVPEVYQCKLATLDAPDSYLLMQYIHGLDLSAARQAAGPEQFDRLQRQLAEMVAKLHENTSVHYTRLCDQNDSQSFVRWHEFFRHVYDPIWHEAERTHDLPLKCRKQLHRIHDHLDQLVDHADVPRLVHWDIWSTNVLARPDEHGNWNIASLLDPNCKFAHAEAEIAYLELFHTVTPVFMKAYQSLHKMDRGYSQLRRPIYQLYSLLNHLRLFGHHYADRVINATAQLAAVV